jgi:quercetin 2,3-dioxygenase
MITLRPARERGLTHLGWLDSRHSFAFGDYRDPRYRGFRTLRVINDDRVAPGGGFAPHPHRNMEILSYIVSGALAHKDSLGNEHIVPAGGVQAMSAGTGVNHSEYNPSPAEPAHFLQIWIQPDRPGHRPSYHEWTPREPASPLQWFASPGGTDGSIPIHQDARAGILALAAGQSLEIPLASPRAAWVQVIDGPLLLNNTPLQPGDGAAIEDETPLKFSASLPARALVFDLA